MLLRGERSFSIIPCRFHIMVSVMYYDITWSYNLFFLSNFPVIALGTISMANASLYSHDHCCSVIQSCLTLWPHELQHTRFTHLSTSPWVCSNSCPLSQWCHPTISSPVFPFIITMIITCMKICSKDRIKTKQTNKRKHNSCPESGSNQDKNSLEELCQI